MTRTQKSKENQQRDLEKRQSRIAETKAFIHSNFKAGLLNNKKWFNMFELFESTEITFSIKTILSTTTLTCEVLEIEDTSLLTDTLADFIEFLEIEWIEFPSEKSLKGFLAENGVDYIDNGGMLRVHGYRR